VLATTPGPISGARGTDGSGLRRAGAAWRTEHRGPQSRGRWTPAFRRLACAAALRARPWRRCGTY